jgi:hypothetical protein
MRGKLLWAILAGGLACAFSGKALAQGGELTLQDAKDKVRTSSYCKKIAYQMTAGKTYQIDMKSTQIDPYLRLEDPTGQQVAFDDDGGGFPNARIVYAPKDSGLFTIVCTTYGGGSTGKYTLDVKEVIDPVLTIKVALNPEKSQLGANYTVTASVHSRESGVVRAEITVPQGDRVVSSPPDQSISAGGSTTFSWTVTCGAAGKVSVLVKMVDVAHPLVKDFAGELTASDPKDSVRTSCFSKIFTYQMEKGRTYQIDMKSKEIDSYLRLENPGGVQVAFDDDSGGTLDARIIYKAQESGTFKIIATTCAGGAGKFTLTVKATESAPVSGAEPSQAIPANSTWVGTEAAIGSLTFIFNEDGKATKKLTTFANAPPEHGTWTQAGRNVTIRFKDYEYTGQIKGTVLQGVLQYTDGTERGWSFRVQVQGNMVRGEQPLAKECAGELTANDPKDSVRTNSFAKIFTYQMEKGRTYQIDMKSKEFDSYLRLENPGGAQVAADDDSGGYPDARIVHQAQESGAFKVVATSFAGGAGNFTLTIRDATPGSGAASEANQLKFTDGKATFTGSEDLAGFGALTFVFGADGKVTMVDAKITTSGDWTQNGRTVTLRFSNCLYTGQIDGAVLQGNAHFTEGTARTWSFRVQKR